MQCFYRYRSKYIIIFNQSEEFQFALIPEWVYLYRSHVDGIRQFRQISFMTAINK